MGALENIARADMKLRVVVAVGIVVLVAVTLPALLILQSELGFVIGGAASVVAAALTARWLFAE